MDVGEAALLFCAAVAGGALNSVAGGGSFLTFPALVFALGDPIIANATSTVALWPGSAGSAVGYRSELRAEARTFRWLALLSGAGGLIGAVTLIETPKELFEKLLPFLLLLATLIFTFGERLRALLASGRAHRGGVKTAPPPGSFSRAQVAVLQLLVAIYGGYFGGGMGLMMLAVFTLLGMSELHRMNALKAGLGMLINGVAVAVFVAGGKISWPPACVMAVGAVLGGFGGASVARRLAPARVRPVVIAIGWGMTLWFFARAFGG